MAVNDQLLSGSNTFYPWCRWNLVQFGLMCSYTMGLPAMWMFPYLVYSHTGLFLIAYYILLILVCIPLTLVQLKLGGLFQQGIISIFAHFLPASKGVAVALLVMSFIRCIFWNVYVSYGVYYMFVSLRTPYAWASISNTSNSNEFLQKTGSIESPGTVPWYLGLSLLGTWLLVYVFVFRGPSWFGKVIYVSSPLAIVSLLAILIYSHTAMPSAYESLGYFFTEGGYPGRRGKLSDGVLKTELANPLTWIRALEQHIYSLGLWAGILPTLGNHLGNRKPMSNLTWLIVLLVHSLLPHIGTIAVAPFIHSLAVKKKMPFSSAMNSGPYLLFVVLPESFHYNQVHPIWAFLMYFMFVLFALHQVALIILTIMENAVECFPGTIERVFKKKEILALVLCIFAFLMGLPHVSQGGSHLTNIVHLYVDRVLFAVILFSMSPFIIAYVKHDAFHVPVERFFLCIWIVLASLASCALLVYGHINYFMPYISQLVLPKWTPYFGWMIAVCPLVMCLIGGYIHAVVKSEETGGKKLCAVFSINSKPLTPPGSPPDNDLQANFSQHESYADSTLLKAQRRARREQQMPKAETEIKMTPEPSIGEIAQL